MSAVPGSVRRAQNDDAARCPDRRPGTEGHDDYERRNEDHQGEPHGDGGAGQEACEGGVAQRGRSDPHPVQVSLKLSRGLAAWTARVDQRLVRGADFLRRVALRVGEPGHYRAAMFGAPRAWEAYDVARRAMSAQRMCVPELRTRIKRVASATEL